MFGAGPYIPDFERLLEVRFGLLKSTELAQQDPELRHRVGDQGMAGTECPLSANRLGEWANQVRTVDAEISVPRTHD